MSLRKSFVFLMLASLLHLSVLSFAFADGVSVEQSSQQSSEESSQQSSQQSVEASSEHSSESSSDHSSQQGGAVSLVVALVIVGVALVAGGIVLTVVLAKRTQRESLINQGYRGDGALLRLLAKQSGLTLEQTASVVRKANREAGRVKNRAAVLERKLTTGLVAAKFHLPARDVERIHHSLHQSKTLSRCDKSRLLLTRLCKLAKTRRSLNQRAMAQNCSSIAQKFRSLRLCRTSSRAAKKEKPL
ncbi:MAG: hypothetical protein EP343_14945 [Deltaproteobacteria bacterium]|nr:MAG: hypothetical protein EP343_14945 [Deltaproteobacteria bacterium]